MRKSELIQVKRTKKKKKNVEKTNINIIRSSKVLKKISFCIASNLDSVKYGHITNTSL